MSRVNYNKVGNAHQVHDENKYKKLRKSPHNSPLHTEFNNNYNGKVRTDTSYFKDNTYKRRKNEKEIYQHESNNHKSSRRRLEEDNTITVIISLVVIFILFGAIVHHVNRK